MGTQMFGVFIITVLLIKNSESVRSSFGESCNNTQRCDSQAWLRCFNGICGCVKQEEMKFDNERAKCVSNVGERCQFNLGKGLFETADCAQNSECNSEGFCACGSKYYESLNGTCDLSRSSGEKCSDSEKCSKFENLECIEGICGCNEQKATFSMTDGTCVGLSHENCVNGKCITGAKCTAEGKCVCLPNFFHSPDNKNCYPQKDIYQSCVNHFECLKKSDMILNCVDGFCNCAPNLKYDYVQKYEYKCLYGFFRNCKKWDSDWVKEFKGEFSTRCAPLVGESCPEGFCASNSKCDIPVEKRFDENTRYEFGICNCATNDYTEDRKLKLCAKKHGIGCGYNKECAGDLDCVDKKCTCPMRNHQTFSDAQNACVTIVEGHCTQETICVPNAICDMSIKQCACQQGFLANDYGHCEIEFGRKCSDSSPCDSVASLTCVNNRCSCPDKMYTYSPTLRKCLGLVGATCRRDSPTQQCIENANCQAKIHSSLSGVCKCTSGFMLAVQDHTCQKIPTAITSITNNNQTARPYTVTPNEL